MYIRENLTVTSSGFSLDPQEVCEMMNGYRCFMSPGFGVIYYMTIDN